MFSKILIANRGEIACRIIRTCKRLGIKTIAVYSEADQNSLHVEQADKAILIGPPAASESYLKADTIVKVAQENGAQAVHPGYGFLSENADFARKLEQRGIKLIGPSAQVIQLMGDKLQAREIARKSGVNIVPGTTDPVKDFKQAQKIAAQIGYPLMIKAAAGGGGKGMRLAHTESDLKAGIAAAEREAAASFGDSRIFIEKFIEKPRHIEVQVLGDEYGNIVHLGERECSIQRRHQKVIEESPSPFLTPKTREAMTKQAIKLAKSVNYTSAGTVEFIVDADQQFYFLEMNTRLQVEHAVTEMVTGRDLVEDMIRIAAGEKLNISQKAIAFQGHAIEARIYAEDPTLDFIPSPGKLYHYKQPLGTRIDSGVEEGDEISLYYDPMIAKVITHQSTRIKALHHLSKALNQYVIDGLESNLFFLNALVNHPKVLKGDIHTHFIAEEYPHNFDPERISDTKLQKLFKTCAVLIFTQKRDLKEVILKQGEIVEEILVSTLDLQIEDHNASLFCFKDAVGTQHWIQVKIGTTDVTVSGYGYCARFEIYPIHLKPYLCHLSQNLTLQSDQFIRTSMPGKLIQLIAKEGDCLKRGQPVAIVEAMKMENILRAPHDGLVKRIYVHEGQTLESNQKLIEVG